MQVYIAGPLSADTREKMLTNVEQAVLVGNKVRKLGHQPYVPHLMFFADEILQRDGCNIAWYDWVREDLYWLETCDALLMQGDWRESKGSWVEYIVAKHIGLTVFESFDDFECWCKACNQTN